MSKKPTVLMILDGYGLNEHLIEEAKREGVGMIVTCDNGIAAAPQIELANSLGMRVVVTDHHEIPYIEENGERKEQLPPALAVVDPKRSDDTYPFPGICGGVVALKVIQAITEKTGNPGLINIQDELLEFAALSTVCDVMELKDENRILVKEGLKRIQKGYNEGLKALMEVNDIAPDRLSAYHLGFVLGPCLNATGRLDTAKRALELLQSFTRADAMTAARELKDLNESRKNLTVQGIQRADEYILEHHMTEDKVMVIYLPEVHESIAGIIAGKVREKYHHPVFILTKGEDGVKGSGRSIEAYHMYDAMTQVKQFFTKYGGHKLAAGLSMREEDIEPLRTALNEKCTLMEDDFIPRVHIDVAMPMGYADDALAARRQRCAGLGGRVAVAAGFKYTAFLPQRGDPLRNLNGQPRGLSAAGYRIDNHAKHGASLRLSLVHGSSVSSSSRSLANAPGITQRTGSSSTLPGFLAKRANLIGTPSAVNFISCSLT